MTTLSNLFSRLFNFLVCCLGVLWEIFTMIFPFFAWWIFSTRHHRFNFTLRRSNASSCFNFRNIRIIVFWSFWLAGVINFLYRNEIVTTTNFTIPSNLLWKLLITSAYNAKLFEKLALLQFRNFFYFYFWPDAR